jgi:hypothetical protein
MKSDAENAKAVAALEANWRAERETALVYRDLAANEADEKRRGILLRMAEAEERHALRWESKLRELGAESPVLKNDWRRRLNRWWNRTAGADVAIRRMEAAEDRDKERYQAQRVGALGSGLRTKLLNNALNANTDVNTYDTAGRFYRASFSVKF